MKKTYITPSVVVEASLLPALMDTLSVGTVGFGGGNGDAGGGNFVIDSKAEGYFGTWDEEDED